MTHSKSEVDVTQLLLEWSRGSQTALDRLMPLVYGELRRMASRYLRGERSDHTLQPTALIHEAYLKLVDQKRVQWQNRAQFFGLAGQFMRRILVSHARARDAAKRGAGATKLALRDDDAATAPSRELEVIALDRALERLAALDPRQARIVELRFFAGLEVEECAEVAGVSRATVNRELATARAWLHRELTRSPAP